MDGTKLIISVWTHELEPLLTFIGQTYTPFLLLEIFNTNRLQGENNMNSHLYQSLRSQDHEMDGVKLWIMTTHVPHCEMQIIEGPGRSLGAF